MKLKTVIISAVCAITLGVGSVYIFDEEFRFAEITIIYLLLMLLIPRFDE